MHHGLAGDEAVSTAAKLKLPDVTLVMVETREHELARMAIEDCLKVASFGDLVILTDKPSEFDDLCIAYTKEAHQFARVGIVPDWPDKLGWSRAWWFDVPPLIRTRHTLNIQWDSWITNVDAWRDEFLDYDYIGAPWWYTDGKNVGNGGFSLVSTRLKRFIFDRRAKFPCVVSSDDDLLCRKYRTELEGYGFRWAPERVAREFAFECVAPAPGVKPFGFHAMFNWPKVLGEQALVDRMKIAMRSPYISASKYMIDAFVRDNPTHAHLLNTKEP